MPNNSVVEERVVEMRIDNAKFEAGAKKTIGILEELDRSLKGLGKENSDGFDAIESSLDKVTDRFSAFGIVGDQVIRNLTNKAMDLVNQLKNVTTTLTTQQIDAGWNKYADKTQAIQTIMAATNKTIEEGRFADQAEQLEWVNEQIEKLNKFTDETSYNFLDMVGNIGKFTSAGRELEESVTAMEGIAAWAAISGGRPTEASRAMYNLSQALGVGAVTVQDWKSIENANMATAEFKQQVIEIAEEYGNLRKIAEDTWAVVGSESKTNPEGILVSVANFREGLKERWFDSNVLLSVLNRYGEFSDKMLEEVDKLDTTATDYLKAMKLFKEAGIEGLRDSGRYAEDTIQAMLPGLQELSRAEYELGYRAFQAAQEAKTFQEAIDATKDAVSTKWMDVFELLFGNYLEAKELWTDLSEVLWNVFAGPVDRLKEIIKGAYGVIGDEGDVATGGMRKMAASTASFQEKLASVGKTMKDFEKAVYKVGDRASLDLIENFNSVEEALKNGAISAELFKQALGAMDDDYDKSKTVGLNRALNKAGKSMNDFNRALLKVADESTIETIRNFGSIEEAVKSGAVSMDLFRQALTELGIDSTNVVPEVEQQVKSAVGSMEEMRDVALGILRGDYDNGEERRKLIEEMGLDYELMQAMAGDLKNFGYEITDEALLDYMEQYYQHMGLSARLGYETFAEYLAATTSATEEYIYSMDQMADEAENVLASIYGADVLDASGEVKHAGELFREGLKNIMTIVNDFTTAVDSAFMKVFARVDGERDAIENLSDKFWKLTAGFREFTKSIQLVERNDKGEIINTDRLDRVTDILSGILSMFQLVGKVAGIAFKIIGTGIRVVFTLLSPVMRVVATLFGSISDSIDLVSGALGSGGILDKIEEISDVLVDKLLPPIEGIANVLGGVIGIVATGVVGAFSLIGDFFSRITGWISNSELLSGIWNFIIDAFQRFGNVVKRVAGYAEEGYKEGGFLGAFAAVAESFERGVKRLIPNGERLIEIFDNVTKAISGLFKRRTDENAVDEFADETEGTLLKLEDTVETIGSITRGISDGLFGDEEQKQVFQERVSKFIGTVWEGILNGLRSIRISDVIGAMRLSLIASIATDILGAVTVFKNIGERIKSIPEVFINIGDNFSRALKGLAATFTANAVLKIAISIGLLAFAFAKMAKIPKEDLTHAAAVTAVVISILVLLAKELGKISINTLNIFKEMPSLAGALFGFAAIIAALGGTLVALTLVQYAGVGKLWSAVGAIIAIISFITLVMAALVWLNHAYNEDDLVEIGSIFLKFGASMAIIAVAMQMIMVPVIALSLLQHFGVGIWSSVLAVIATMLSFALMLSIVLRATNNMNAEELAAAGGVITRLAASMMIIVVALQMLTIPIVALSLLQHFGVGIWGAVATVGLLLAALLLFVKFTIDFIRKTAGDVEAMSELGKTLMRIGAAVALVALSVKMITGPIVRIATLANQINDWHILKSLGYLLLAVAAIGGILTLINKWSGGNGDSILKIAAAMSLLALALLLLTPAILGLVATGSLLVAFLGLLSGDAWEVFQNGLKRLLKLSGALLVFGAAVVALGLGALVAGAGVVTLAGGLLLFTVALAILIVALPKFVDMLLDLREISGEELRSSLKKVAGVVMMLTAGLIVLSLVLAGLFRFLRPGFITSISDGIVKAIKSIMTGIASGTKSGFEKIIEFLRDPKNKRVILTALESIIVLAGAYIAGIIPSLTHVIFGGIVELISSLADELETQKDVLVESVTRLIKGVLDVVTELIGSLFGEKFQNSLSSSEKWLFRIAVAFGVIKSIAAAMNITTGFSKLKDFLTGGGKGGGLISNLTSVKGGIEKIILAAGGLGPTLAILGLIVGASAYAIDNLNKQQQILEENAFDGETRSLEGYANAIEKTQARINELQELNDSGWDTEMSVQELSAQQQLLSRLTKEYNELLKAQEKTAQESVAVSKELSDADEARSEKFAMKQATRTEAIKQETEALEEEKTSLEGLGGVIDELKEKAGDFDLFGITKDAFSEQGFDINDFVTVNGTFDTEKITSLLDTDTLKSSIENKVKSVAPSVGEGLADGLPDGYSFVSSGMSDFKNNIVEFFCQELGINSPSKVFTELGIGIPEGVAAGVENGKYLPLGGLANMMTAMVNMFNGTSQRFYNSGVAIVQGLINGIGNNFQAAFNTGRNLAVSIENGFNSRLKIRSPSKVFMELAGYITQGLAMGIENSSDTAIDSIVVLGDELMQAIERSMAMVSVMADEDFTISPRIAPVVDLSMARGASGTLNDLFRSPSLYATVGRVTNEQANRYSAYGPTNTSNQATINELHALSEQVDALNEAITNMQIVLDSGVLVGATSAKMDQRLGQMAVRKGRGN